MQLESAKYLEDIRERREVYNGRIERFGENLTHGE